MKKAVVLVGAGFSDANETLKMLQTLGFKAETWFLGQQPSSQLWPKADLVVLRGPWKMNSAEVLMVQSMVRRWRPQLETLLNDPQHQTTVVGIGRGALILFSMLAGKSSAFSDWTWESVLENEQGWVDVQIGSHGPVFKSLMLDCFRPELVTPIMFQMESWITIKEVSMGWKMKRHLYLSLVDIFAFQDRAQHADFGYTDLSHLSMPQDLFSVLFPGV